MSNIYDELGIKKLVNSAGTYTVIGGSRMSEASLRAMAEAAADYVPLFDLRDAVQRRIAELTQNEDSAITAGAIVGVYLCIAACVSKKLGKAIRYISKEDIKNSEVIIFRAHRNAYDRGLELLGVKVVELGYPNNIDMATAETLRNAITDKTAGVLYLLSAPGGWVPTGALPVEETLDICKEYDIPVVIDAAAQLPPKSNLWHYTKDLSASAIIFSGGKDLNGPQTTGVVLGKKDFLKWVHINNFPNYDIGRMHKVGREEFAGIYTAVKEYVEHDEEARLAEAEKMVASFVDAFDGTDAFHFERVFPNESGQPLPRARLIITKAGLTPDMICEELYNKPRAIFAMVDKGYLYVNSYKICQEEAEYILSVYKELNEKYKNQK